MSHGFEVVSAEVAYKGVIVDTEIRQIRTPDGDIVERQVVCHPGAVAVIAIHDRAVVLVRQYRAAIDDLLIEIPAGKLDVAGEPAEHAARRELVEEVGLVPGRIERLGSFVTAAGFSDEEITIFAAFDCESVPRAVDGVEEAHSEVLAVPIDEALEWARTGRITDSKTIIGLFWANERGLLDP